MSPEVWTFWCEWDIGITGAIFASEELARLHIKEALINCDIEDDLDVLIAEGMVGIEHNYVITELTES